MNPAGFELNYKNPRSSTTSSSSSILDTAKNLMFLAPQDNFQQLDQILYVYSAEQGHTRI
jgi:hypothetical protein